MDQKKVFATYIKQRNNPTIQGNLQTNEKKTNNQTHKWQKIFISNLQKQPK